MRNLGLVESGDGYFGMAARRDEKKHHSFKILPSRMKEIEKRKKKSKKEKRNPSRYLSISSIDGPWRTG